MEYDDTCVVASVNDRSQRDLMKRFDDMNIDWQAIEKQLIRWDELLRLGKKLRIDLSFNYKDSSLPTSAAANRGNKRGSTTQNACRPCFLTRSKAGDQWKW